MIKQTINKALFPGAGGIEGGKIPMEMWILQRSGIRIGHGSYREER